VPRFDSNPHIRVGGFAPVSFTDRPDQIVATVFCQGCPWDCGYCHNPDLIPRDGGIAYDWQAILRFLETRRGLLDGVVFSGGEPLLQRGLPCAMREVRALGYHVGLHTGGAYPARMAEVLPLLDWVGFDIKAGAQDYARVTGVPGSAIRAHESLRLLRESGVAFETRTTLDPQVFDDAAMTRLRADLTRLGLDGHRLQAYRNIGIRPTG